MRPVDLAITLTAAAVLWFVGPDSDDIPTVAEPVATHPDAWRFDRVEAATSTSAAVRVQIPTTPPPPTSTTTTTTVPTPIPGDCSSWSPVILARGGDASEVEFFVDRGILWRESGCGLDNLNESSGDSGVCQINPVHNRAGWFDGVEYGSGGWLYAVHGLRTWENVDAVEWIDACLTLFRVCGSAPWTPPYGCDRRAD